MRYVKFTKLVSLLLAFSTVLLIISACTDKDENDGITENITDTPIDEEVILSTKETSDYTFVYPEGITASVSAKITEIFKEAKEKSSVTLKVKDDFLKKTESADGQPEVLFGYTNRAQSKEVMSEIGYFDWKIEFKGEKIVVAAHTEEALIAAIDHFKNELLEYEDGKVSLKTTAQYKSQKTVFFTEANKLESYSIIYPAGNSELEASAKELKTLINRKFSVDLPIKADSEAELECEILVGAVNRTAVEKYKNGLGALSPVEHFFGVSGKKVLIMGLSDHSTQTALGNFKLYTDLETPCSYIFNFESDLARKEVAYIYDDRENPSDDFDLRVMSYNILSQALSNGTNDYIPRCPLWCSEILYRNADIVGMQEIDQRAYELIEDYIGDTYAFVNKKNANNKHSYTSILYNTDTLVLKESGVINYEEQLKPDGGSTVNSNIRVIQWGVFEKKGSGEQFIFVSTHWNANNYGDLGMNIRAKQATELTTAVNDLIAKYSLPLISTGDFNCVEDQDYFARYIQDTDQCNSRATAGTVMFDESNDRVIDHITYTKENLEAVFYRRVDTPATAKASDHDPAYTDIKFK